MSLKDRLLTDMEKAHQRQLLLPVNTMFWLPPIIISHQPSLIINHQSPPIINHRQSSPIIANVHQSSPIVTNHHQSSPITTNHHQSPPIIPNHHESSSIIISHYQSSPIAINHHHSSPISNHHKSSSSYLVSHIAGVSRNTGVSPGSIKRIKRSAFCVSMRLAPGPMGLSTNISRLLGEGWILLKERLPKLRSRLTT